MAAPRVKTSGRQKVYGGIRPFNMDKATVPPVEEKAKKKKKGGGDDT